MSRTQWLWIGAVLVGLVVVVYVIFFCPTACQ